MKKHLLGLAMAASFGFAVTTPAQQPTQPMDMQNPAAMPCMMAMHGMMMGDGMAGEMVRPGERAMGGMHGRPREMMNDSSHMAQMRSELGLSEAQMQQFHGIVQRACTAAQPHMTMAMQAHQAAMQALQGDNPKLDQFEDQLDKAAKHMVAAQVEMAKGMIEVRKALNPAQRQKLDQMHQQMMQDRMHRG
jgi:Spy/CpxP family protein refolding chaperone